MTGPQPRPPLAAAGLSRLSDLEFVALWSRIAGGPPAILLERDEMIALLLDLAAENGGRCGDGAAASDGRPRG